MSRSIFATLQPYPGSSGGPLWYEKNGAFFVKGVVSTDGWSGSISPHYANIQQWIPENDGLLGSAKVASVLQMEKADVELAGIAQDQPISYSLA